MPGVMFDPKQTARDLIEAQRLDGPGVIGPKTRAIFERIRCYTDDPEVADSERFEAYGTMISVLAVAAAEATEHARRAVASTN